MQKLHKDLCERHPWYEKWHDIPLISALHFLVLTGFGVLLTSTIVTTATLALAPDALAARGEDNSIQALTTNVLRLAAQTGPGAENRQALDALKKAIDRREAALLELAHEDPHQFLLNVIPADVVEQLPEQVRSKFEEEATVSGTLTVLHADALPNENGHEHTLYELDADEEYELYIDTTGRKFEREFQTGDKLNVNGYRLGKVFVAAQSGTTVTTPAIPGAITAGPQKTLVMLVNFTNKTSVPATLEQVDATVFSGPRSTDKFYQENSFSTVSLYGDVTNWLTIPHTDASCSTLYNTFATAADAAAVAAGHPVSEYPRRIYVLNSSTCGWGGLGTIGGNPSKSWIPAAYATRPEIYGHELGHNFRAHHAQWLKCGTAAIAPYSSCTLDEYGDRSDVMGYAWGYFFQYNGPRKIGEVWLASASNMAVVTSNNTYTLSAIENNDSTLKILKIAKPDSSDAYYVSYRQPLGIFDSTLPAGFVNGATINAWNGFISAQTKLIDTTPGDNNSLNAPLADGRGFTDAANGITITQLSHSTSSVTVSVSFGGVECVRGTPTLTVSPLSQGGHAEFGLRYSLSLKNNDSAACQSTNFIWSNVAPAGWTVAIAGYGATVGGHVIAPGDSGIADMYITPPADTVDGSYQVTINASDPVLNRVASTQAGYVSFTPDSTPPTTAITSPPSGSTLTGPVTVLATASDNVVVTRVELLRNGFLVANDTTAPYELLWDTTGVSGTHTLQTRAYDAAGNVGSSDPITVTVQVPPPPPPGDTTPPTVTITSPANGAVTRGSASVTINTSASDASGIGSIDIKIDGPVVKTCANATSCSYSWSGKSIVKGTHTITVTATDTAGNSASASVTIRK